MKVLEAQDLERRSLPGSVLTLGNFDGVHRGHQQLLAQGGLLAESSRLPLTVLTFEPHPLSIVAPDKTPPRLMDLSEKLAQLAAAGVDVTVVARSTRPLLAAEPEDFVREFLVRRFRPSHVVEGPSFGFGRARRGNVQMLRELGAVHGFEVCVVGPVEFQIEPHRTVLVSSSLIRDLLRRGEVHRAALCLGRPYGLGGSVVQGLRRGTELGFPTINLDVGDRLVPADGVYAGLARLDTVAVPAAISIGTAPTFGLGPQRVEAFLLDFCGELYGQRARLEFLRWLRPQKRYPTPEALVDQMRRDVAEVRAYAASAAVTPGEADPGGSGRSSADGGPLA